MSRPDLDLATAVDRSQPPPPGELRPFRFPAFQRARLDNGMQILAARMPRYPLVGMEILMPAGGQYNPATLPGLAGLHGELLDEGSEIRPALQIADQIEALGGSLSSGASWNVAYVDIDLLSAHLQPGLELLAEIVRSPSFENDEIERIRQERLAEILRLRGQPASVADWTFAATVYAGTPYGLPLIGTEESLKRMTRDDVHGFYRRHVVAAGSILVAVGDLDPDELFTAADKLFGDWRSPPAPERPTFAPAMLNETQVHLVDRPGSAQTQLQVGHASLPRQHPDFVPLLLLNAILGGKFTSRINLNLRERHGYTYGASSFVVQRQGPGPFFVRTAVANEVAGAATREIVDEIRQIREQAVTVDELRETQDYLVGVFPYTLQTIDDLVNRLEALAVFELPEGYFDNYPSLINGTTRDQLLRAGRRHLHPDTLAIVAAGPADELRPQFEALGPVTIHSPG
ncbi:MAG: pitrilysin family protein [Thermoanaerobaculia bacterium]